MNKNKMISIAFAVIAALLVIWAGKGCADSINERNNRNKPTGTAPHYIPDDNNVLGTLPEYLETIPTTTTTTDPNIEYITDMLGRVEGSILKEQVTDENGNTVTTAVDGVSDEVQGTEEPTAETTRSILDSYKEKENDSSLSGYNHKKKKNDSDDSQQPTEQATFPSDFTIVVK